MFLLPERFQGFAYSKFQSVPGRLHWTLRFVFWPVEPYALVLFLCPFLCLAGWNSLEMGVLFTLFSGGA